MGVGMGKHQVFSGRNRWGGSLNDLANSIQQTSDGGYIVAGNTNSNNGDVSSNHGGYDCWVIKLDNSSNIQWQKSYGSSQDDGAASIQQTSDGGYVFAGYSGSNDGDVSGHHLLDDFWVVKLDSTGGIQWQKSLGGSSYEDAYSVRQTTDGGYIIAGYSFSIDGDVTGNHNGYDYWVVKLDNIGNLQ